MTKYLVLPGLDTSELGSSLYIFDRNAISANVIRIPTQKVSAAAASIITKLKTLDRRPRTLEELDQVFERERERKFVRRLIAWGYLEAAGVETSFLDRLFHRPTFFNLPVAPPDVAADVGLVGVPFSSTVLSSGTTVGADFLRRVTGQTAFWFDVYRHGFLSDVGVDGVPRKALGRGVVAWDFGDLGGDARSVGDLFSATEDFTRSVVVERGIRPIFVGGDHAITFPIVNSLLRRYPRMALLHLDAHHDLFYSYEVGFHHATPIRSLLAQGLQRVYSFGLRTTFDPRTHPLAPFDEDPSFEGRVRHYSLPALRRLSAEPNGLARALAPLAGRPCYLSIDLDVLSQRALSHRTSTPAGAGLEWMELLEVIALLFDCANVIAADVVELNPYRTGTSDGEETTHLPALLALLMDRLSRSKIPKPAKRRGN